VAAQDDIAEASTEQAPLRQIKLILAYDGSRYHGWQSQTSGHGIQDALEKVLHRIVGERVITHASGRTDTGVHALGQVVTFQTREKHSLEIWQKALHGFLPLDIAVLSIEETALDFHPRRSAKLKRYRYLWADGPIPEVFARRYLYTSRRPLNVDLMQQAANTLLGYHDFAAYASSGSKRKTTDRTVHELRIWRPFANTDHGRLARDSSAESTTGKLPVIPLPEIPTDKMYVVHTKSGAGEGSAPPGLLENSPAALREYPILMRPEHLVALEILADGFLYNMVRIIAGTLTHIGAGSQPISWAADILATKDRRQAGQTAEAQGLYLVEVLY
jgi:tRNA pseudouridine38-40 synthase